MIQNGNFGKKIISENRKFKTSFKENSKTS